MLLFYILASIPSNLFHCNCCWVDCDDIHSLLLDNLESDHVWIGNSIRLEFGSKDISSFFIKKYVLLKSSLKHCVSTTETGGFLHSSNLFLRCHHFPVALLQYKKKNSINQTTVFLSKEIMKNICKDDGHHRFLEQSNTVIALSQGFNFENLKHNLTSYNNLYVKSPMSSRVEVNKEILHFIKLKHKKETLEDKQSRIPRWHIPIEKSDFYDGKRKKVYRNKFWIPFILM